MNSEYSTQKIRKQISHDSSSHAIDTQRSNSKIDSHINQLYSRFMTLNKQVSIDHDVTAFNMAELQKQDSKFRYDQQMVQVKLKRLENSFELKKANLQLQHRQKRSLKKRSLNTLNQEDSYLNIYKRHSIVPPTKVYKGENQSESDEQGKNNQREPIKGIGYFNELKKHPKFLQYTIDKLKQKELIAIEQKSEKTEALEKLKKSIKQLAHTQSLNKGLNSEINPQELADNIFRKIYTKRNKDPPLQETRTDRRIAKMIDKQDSILSSLEQRSLSKQNYKKLKGRMNDIANQLYRYDKKHSNKLFLPKIRLNNISTIEHNHMNQ